MIASPVVSVRRHFHRVMQGTSTLERLQVHHHIQDGLVQVQTYYLLGTKVEARTKKTDDVAGELEDVADEDMKELLSDDWKCDFDVHYRELDTSATPDMVSVKIETDVDLSADLDRLCGLSKVAWAAEAERTILIGQSTIKIARKRRKAGEKRPLRLDTINAVVAMGSFESAVLGMLGHKHGGFSLDDRSQPVDLMPQVRKRALNPVFADVALQLGINIPRFDGQSIRRPNGHEVQPAVF